MRFITASKAAVARRGFSQPEKMVFWATETYKQPAMTTTQETARNYAVCVCVCVWDSQRRTIRCSDAPLPSPWKRSPYRARFVITLFHNTHIHTVCLVALQRPLVLQIHICCS